MKNPIKPAKKPAAVPSAEEAHRHRIMRIKFIPKEKLPELIKKAKNGNKNIRKKIILSHLRQIEYQIWKFMYLYRPKNMTNGDFVLAGVRATDNAINRYDPRKGNFETYLVRSLHSAFRREYYKYEKTVRMGVTLQEKASQIKKIEREIEARGEEPTIEAISKISGMKEETVKKIKESELHVFSIEKPLATAGKSIKYYKTLRDGKSLRQELETRDSLRELVKMLKKSGTSERNIEIWLARTGTKKDKESVTSLAKEYSTAHSNISNIAKKVDKKAKKIINRLHLN